MPTPLGLPAPALLGTLVAFLLFWLIPAILSYRRLRHIPGPKAWAWSRLPLIRVHITGDSYDGFGAISEQYGKLVRIGPNYVLSSDPDIVRRINAPRSPYTKSNWYLASRFTPGVDNMISDRDEKRHEMMRKKVAPVYAGKSNPDLERDIDECILELVHLIDSRYLTVDIAQPVRMELAKKVQYFTTDVISKLSFNGKFHDLRDDNDNMGYINEIESLFPKVFCTSVMPELIELLTKTGILKLLNPLNSTKMAFGKVMAITRTQIESRFDPDGKPIGPYGDMIGGFIKHGLTRQEMEQEAIVQLAAGSDTSATAIRATMLGLMTNRNAYQKLHSEIDNAAQAQKIPPVSGDVISDANAKELPYLQAVIKEGLRWYPPTGGLLAKEVPKEGDTVSGYYLPGGTIIGYSAKAVHNSTALFGPDRFDFRPERWLHTSQGGDEPSWDKIKAMERNNDLVFGHGKYQCLGKGIAFMELNKVFVELLRRFDFTLLDPNNPWETVCYGIHLQKGLWVSVRRRADGGT